MYRTTTNANGNYHTPHPHSSTTTVTTLCCNTTTTRRQKGPKLTSLGHRCFFSFSFFLFTNKNCLDAITTTCLPPSAHQQVNDNGGGNRVHGDDSNKEGGFIIRKAK